MPSSVAPPRRAARALVFTALAAASCRSPHPSADEATELWADASNRDNQLKQLVIRYQESSKRIDDYRSETEKVDAKLRDLKEKLGGKRDELASARAELEAATRELETARTGAAAARQHAAESRRLADEAAKEGAEQERRKNEILARLTEKRSELEALERAEGELKKKLAAAVDRAVVLRESTSGAGSSKQVRLTINSVRRDGVVSVVAKGSDKLQVGDVAEVRRQGERVGRLTLVDAMISAPADSDAPAIYAARFEAEKQGVTPSLSDEITVTPPDR